MITKQTNESPTDRGAGMSMCKDEENEERGVGNLFKMLAGIILPPAISKKLGELKKWLTLKEKLRNYAPKTTIRQQAKIIALQG